MTGWKDCKDSGSWAFTPQENKWGYLPNPRWSAQQDAIDFCEDKGLLLDLPDEHLPCGHWHKAEVTEEPFPAGKWVAAMQQPGTPYIYVYDIVQKAVIRIDTSEIPVFVSSRLELNSTYDLDYTMGANVDSQHGGYCMNKDGTRIWYLFTKKDGDRSDAELIEVDISKTNMLKVKSTIFSNLVPSESLPSSNNERINDGCSDDVHTYWCTNLLAGRIIKIRNSDHSIIDSHIFNYAIECGSSGTAANKPIATIDVHKNTGKLYWIYTRDHSCSAPPYSVCKYFIRADLDLVADVEQVVCASGIMTAPWYQNMIKIYSDRVLLHQSYHPCTGPLTKWELNLSEENIVEGTNSKQYICKKDHTAAPLNKPVTGANWTNYWTEWNHLPDGNVWQDGKKYHCSYIQQEILNNILGVKNGKLFTLMHVCSGYSESFLYCIDFSDMTQLSNVDVSYYTGHIIFAPDPTDWLWTGVSALNQQTGVIVIFRYHLYEKRNYAGCFNANSDLGFLCDVPLYSIRHDSNQEMSDEPQIWTMPGDEVPAPAEPTLPGPTSPGSPPGSVICMGHTPQLSQNPISVSVMEGSSAVNRSIKVTDNCGDSLAFQIEEVNNNNWAPWISSPNAGDTGVGFLSINFNIMPAGNYSGNIKISTSLGNLTLNIILVVTATPAHGEPAAITLIKGELHRGFDFALGEIKLFKFRADSGPGSPLLTAVTKIQTHADLHSMVKYAGQNWEGSSLTESDYNGIMAVIAADPTQSSFSSNPNPQFPAYGPINGIYYHRTRFFEKTIKINYLSQITNGCWYFWIKNIGALGSDVDLFDCKVYFDF